MTKSPFTGTCERGEGLLDLVHTDVCGPFRSATKDGKHYYVTFTDDFSRYGYVYLTKHKSDTFEEFKRYQNKVENQVGRKINELQSDRGGKYLSIEFFDHLKNCGIVLQLTPPRTPQLNGVPERRNITMLDMKGKPPSLGHIKIWGCEVFIRQEAKDKLEAISEKCFSVGHPEESFGYLFYKPKDNVVFVAQRGVFLEREITSKEDSRSKIDLEEIQESVSEEPIVNTDTQQEVVTPVEPDDISLPIHKTSSRVRKPPQFYYSFHIEEDMISDNTLTGLNEPANYKEAMTSPETAKWKEVMKSEIQSMYDNQVWNSVNTTPGLKMVGFYGGEEKLKVTGYYDASWETDKDDSRSQSGWVFLLNGGAVTWKSLKQDTMANSTCEFEYIAADYSSSDHFTLDDSSPDSLSDSTSDYSSDTSLGYSIPDCPCDSPAAISAKPSSQRYSNSVTGFEVSSDESYEQYVAREVGLGVDVEESYEPYSKPDIDSDVQADINARIAADDSIAAREMDVRVKVGIEVEEEAKSSARVIKGAQRSSGYASIVASEQRAELLDRTDTLERDNMRLKGMLGVERQRVDYLWRSMSYAQRDLSQICQFCFYDRIVVGTRVAIPLEAVEEVRSRFANTLYGYFIGKRLAFPLVENYVKNTWAKFGLK
ncbi:putative RNA-directed DNA polymerase, partial [Tanacetum coccineum]